MERFIKQVIEESNPSLFFKGLRGFLYLLSLLFRLSVGMKNGLYALKVMKEKPTKVSLICIGNIVAGGVGKTPFVQRLAKDLGQEDLAIITTGYKSVGASKSFVISAVSPIYSGDEAFLLQEKLPRALVLVCKKRLKAIDVALKKNASLVILDDGMQDRTLSKKLLVALIDASDPFGRGHFLPRGYLRESPRSLCRADYICVTNVTSRNQYTALKNKLMKYTSAEMMGGRKQPTGITGQKQYRLEELRGLKVGAFCGLGNPSQFFQSLEELGAEIVEKKELPDHGSWSATKLSNWIDLCKEKEAICIVCSEKDFVKLDAKIQYKLPVCFLEIMFKLEYGVQAYRALLTKALKQTSKQCEATI